MARALDKNYYPMPFPGGSSLVSESSSGDDTIEIHEFYNSAGKVVFYWKLKRASSNKIIDLRLKIPERPADPSVAYKGYDELT